MQHIDGLVQYGLGGDEWYFRPRLSQAKSPICILIIFELIL